MFRRPRIQITAIMFLAALAPLVGARAAAAQSARGQQRLNALQQQIAFQQQQNAVQAALQQTATLVQAAYQQNGVSQQASTPNLPNFQQQANALQIAIQETYALLQSSFRLDSGVSQTALQQLNTLQLVLQQSLSLQNQLPVANSPFSTFQQQILAQEQNSLMSLMTAQPPRPIRTRARR